MKINFEWTEERRNDFDNLVQLLIDRNFQDCSEKYRSKSAMEEQDQYYYGEEDAWEDIQSIIKGEKTLYE